MHCYRQSCLWRQHWFVDPSCTCAHASSWYELCMQRSGSIWQVRMNVNKLPTLHCLAESPTLDEDEVSRLQTLNIKQVQQTASTVVALAPRNTSGCAITWCSDVLVEPITKQDHRKKSWYNHSTYRWMCTQQSSGLQQNLHSCGTWLHASGTARSITCMR